MKPTIITSFFDIGRGDWSGPAYMKRTTDHYFESFEALLNLDNDIVVFTSLDLQERFFPYCDKKSNLTVIGYLDWRKDIWPEFFEPIKKVQADPEYQKMITTPWNPEYWSVDYVMVNMMKSYFVNYAIESGLVETDLAAWIDFGYAKYDNCVPTKSWRYNFNPDKIHFFTTKKHVPTHMDVVPIVMTNDVWITGCHIVAGKQAWKELLNLVYHNLSLLLSHNLIDDDQTILYMCYCKKPELFEIHKIEPDDWFCMFRRFNDAIN